MASPSLQKIHFWENHRGSQIDPPAFLGLKQIYESKTKYIHLQEIEFTSNEIKSS